MARSKAAGTRVKAVVIRTKAGGSLADVRDSVQRLRAEGQRFMLGIRRETETFARRARAEIDADMRKVRQDLRGRADSSLKDLESRGRRVVGTLEKQIARLAGGAQRSLAGVRLGELPKLAKRLETLEQRIMRLERQLRDVLPG